MPAVIIPGNCVEIKEAVFYLEKGKPVYAGERKIIGRIIGEKTSYGFYDIEVIACEGPNPFLKGLNISRPEGNILSAVDCTPWINMPPFTQRLKAGGHLEGVRDGEKVALSDAKQGGIGVGASHAHGGIQGEVGTGKRPIEFEGEEIILTAPVSSDNTLYDFEGRQLTPRQIASQLNVDNGGVAFADGGEVSNCRCSGRSYQLGGLSMPDREIIELFNRNSQLQRGWEVENREHRDTLSRLNDGYITLDNAIREIAETHLREDPNYYHEPASKLAEGGQAGSVNPSDIVINNVKIGDKFLDPRNRKNKAVSTVIDIVERKSLATGQIAGYECWAAHDFMGQNIRSEVAFSTVLRYRVQ